MYSMRGCGCAFFFVTAFSLLYSMQRRIDPSFFLTKIVKLANGNVDGNTTCFLTLVDFCPKHWDVFVQHMTHRMSHRTTVAYVDSMVHQAGAPQVCGTSCKSTVVFAEQTLKKHTLLRHQWLVCVPHCFSNEIRRLCRAWVCTRH